MAKGAGLGLRPTKPIPCAKEAFVNKDLFSTASKRDHGLFGEPPLEGMILPARRLDAWIVAARQYQNVGLATILKSAKQLKRLRKVFEAMKYRVRRALDSALKTSFCAREECRISWELVLHVDSSTTSPSGSHHTFWILLTSQVNEFMCWEFNR